MIPSRENVSSENYGIIVLAAGASIRLGKPKQLLQYKGKSLLRYVLDIAKNMSEIPVIVVLGANNNLTSKEIPDDKNVYSIINENWSEGISSSIRTGLNALQQIAPSSDGALLIVCDQPFITASLLNSLIAAHKKTGKFIVACSYENTIGTPVFFHKSLFPELMVLKGDSGAKKIIMKYPDLLATAPFPQGTIDIDTRADYEALENAGD